MNRYEAMSDYVKNDADAKIVNVMTAGGIDNETIALCLGIDVDVLQEHYSEELETSAAKANAKIIQKLYSEATGGNIAAIKWWTQARMGWSDGSGKNVEPKKKWKSAEQVKKEKAESDGQTRT